MVKKLKLYVWENVLWDYGPGMICVFAHNLEEAIELVRVKYGEYYACECGKPYLIVTEPAAFAVSGSG